MGEKDLIIPTLKGLSHGKHRIKCPSCHPKRKKHNQSQRELSVEVDDKGIKYFCHHCGINGFEGANVNLQNRQRNVKTNISRKKVEEIQREIELEDFKHTDKTINFLKERGISEDIIKKHTVGKLYKFREKTAEAIGFPYYDKDNNTVAVKWRSAGDEKFFSQTNSCNEFFNINSIVEQQALIICEGEIDALTWMTVLEDNQHYGVVSVPNGAPLKVSDQKLEPDEDKKYKYIWSAREKLNAIPEIVFSGDNDEQGNALLEEMAKRLGRGKCTIIDLGDHKDANEALQKEGKQFLLDRLAQAKPYPVSGLYRAEDVISKIQELYTDGKPTGYQIHPVIPLEIARQQMTVVTGLPASGKSNFVDDCCIHLARTYGLKICYSSFEKPIAEHITQLVTHVAQKPFFDGKDERISSLELDAALDFVNQHFIFQDFTSGRSTKIEEVLDVASAGTMWGSSILVIDPYNWIEPEQNTNMSEGISNMLTKVQNWAVANDSHVIFVAHPSKLQDRNVPEGMEISGSMAWFAKTDNGITIHREKETGDPLCKIWKVRWSWLGSPQTIHLNHNPRTGAFSKVAGYNPANWEFLDDF
jgi:twinkle protein